MKRPGSMRVSVRRAISAVALALAAALSAAAVIPEPSSADAHTLMPVPRSLFFHQGALRLDRSLTVRQPGARDPIVDEALARALARLYRQTGVRVVPEATATETPIAFRVSVSTGTDGPRGAIEDESYRLSVASTGIRLDASTIWGALHGLETLLQLPTQTEDGWTLPYVSIADEARFPWRGLLIDVARHFMPIEALERNLDAMASLKMNVLHLHLSDDQGFRVESLAFPKLHELGSDGRYYTQDQIRGLVEYAAVRGIRIVPEFDMPGHSLSWLVGYPILASAPGPFELADRWAARAPAIDPTREDVYAFIDAFVAEMVGLFPDPFIHIGGDEVIRSHWRDNPKIRAFMDERGMRDTRELQGYFNLRVREIFTRHDRRMIGWDEIQRPSLPGDVVVQSWRGRAALAEAARRGRQAILSFGYYLDHMQPAAFHYAIDPLGAETGTLETDARNRILGGEAAMWSEFVTPDNLDSRVWPRTAAIAERLWSPAGVDDVDDMYRRLEATSQRLESLGLQHRTTAERTLVRLVEDDAARSNLAALAAVLEPVKMYKRHADRSYTRHTPLDRLVDALPPESDTARVFASRVDSVLRTDAQDAESLSEIRRVLEAWRDNHDLLLAALDASPELEEVRPLSESLYELATVGLAAIATISEGERTPPAVRNRQLEIVRRSQRAHREMVVVVAPAISRLVEAAHETGTAADR